MGNGSIPLPAVIAGLAAGIVLVATFSLVSMAQPITRLNLVPSVYTTEEQFAENDRLFAISENYTIVKEAIRKYDYNATMGTQIYRNSETLEQIRNVPDAEAVVQFIIGPYLQEA